MISSTLFPVSDLLMMEKLFGVMSLALTFGFSIYQLCRKNYVYYL